MPGQPLLCPAELLFSLVRVAPRDLCPQSGKGSFTCPPPEFSLLLQVLFRSVFLQKIPESLCILSSMFVLSFYKFDVFLRNISCPPCVFLIVSVPQLLVQEWEEFPSPAIPSPPQCPHPGVLTAPLLVAPQQHGPRKLQPQRWRAKGWGEDLTFWNVDLSCCWFLSDSRILLWVCCSKPPGINCGIKVSKYRCGSLWKDG